MVGLCGWLDAQGWGCRPRLAGKRRLMDETCAINE